MNDLIKLAKEHNIDIEINEEKSNSTEINMLNDVEKSFEIKNNISYLIKAIKDGKCVFLHTENLDKASVIIDDLENIFKIQENNNENRLCRGQIKNEIASREIIDYQSIKKDMRVFKSLKKEYPLLENIEISYGNYMITNHIINENADMKNDMFYNQWSIEATMKKDNIIKTIAFDFFSKKYDFQILKKKLYEFLDVLLIKLNGVSCKTNKYKIILKNDVSRQILMTFASMFYSKEIELKNSVLVEKFNKKVFSDKITIIEDPQNKDAIIQCFFDEEGTLTTYNELIHEGVFCTKVNNIEYALKLNEKPTGNARDFINLYIKPGDLSYEELIKELNNGIIINEVEGLHSGINIKSGDISIQAAGLLVENGKITKGLNNIILSTNIFELFGNVLMVGNDMSTDHVEYFSPSLLIDNITIAGEE